MLYRKFGPLDFEVSALGFGCMRLPALREDREKVDEPEAIRLIRYAIDHGVNYVDTAYFYHKGQSEGILGKALQDGYRAKVYIATKMPVNLVECYEDFDRLLNEQLNRLATDHIDFYLMHGLDKRSWENIKKHGYEKFFKKALADGRIHYPGFSFHGAYPLFKEIVDAYPWVFCQIQYNYMDTNFQAGTAGLKYAADKGLAIVIMEPIKGGKLANHLPPILHEMWKKTSITKNPAELALRWVWNHPEVTSVLSGMSTFEQVEENLRTVESALPNTLSPEELAFIQEIKTILDSTIKIDCTACDYCQPCPAKVQIPTNFLLYNEAYIYDTMDHSREHYQFFFKDSGSASSCTACGECEEKCPQDLSIRELLKEVARVLE